MQKNNVKIHATTNTKTYQNETLQGVIVWSIIKRRTKDFRSGGNMTRQEKAALIAEFKPVTIQVH